MKLVCFRDPHFFDVRSPAVLAILSVPERVMKLPKKYDTYLRHLTGSGTDMREAVAGSHLSEVNTSSQTGFYIERTNLVPAVLPFCQVS